MQHSEPFWARSEAHARSEGQLSYRDHPPELQAIMRRMYDTDSAYQTLSALFVDRAPGDRPASLLIAIDQPDRVRTAAYADPDGVGSPYEITLGMGETLYRYLPAANTYLQMRRSLSGCRWLLESLPLTVVQSPYTGTTLYSDVWLARLFLHPAELITMPLFCAKQVSLRGMTQLTDRSAWKLEGEQIPTAQRMERLGDRWQMWVDVRTGIVLRLEYYAAARPLGWAELRHVVIDGQGEEPHLGVGALRDWTLPRGVRKIEDPRAFAALLCTHRPGGAIC